MDRMERMIRKYARAGIRQFAAHDAALHRIDERLDRTSLKLEEVTGKLDALIDVVDGMHRRGNPPPPVQ